MQRAESGAMQVQLLELAQLFVDLPLVPEQVLPMQQQRRQKVQRPDDKTKVLIGFRNFQTATYKLEHFEGCELNLQPTQ